MAITCPKCNFVNTTPQTLECPHCGVIYSKVVAVTAHSMPGNAPVTALASGAPIVEEVEEETPFRIQALAIPAAFALAILAKLLVLPGALFWYFFTIPIHEMGHALVAWGSGRVAVPLGALIPMAGFTTIHLNPSNGVLVLDALLIGAAIWFALKSKSKYLFGLAVAAAIACYHLSFDLDQKQWMMTVSWGGIAGEFWISTLLIVSFYYRLPEILRWDFFRFFALVPGGWAFTNVFWMWIQISRAKAGLPLGSFMEGRGDAGGDIQRMMEYGGWSGPTVTAHYMLLGEFCLAIIAGHYLFFLFKARKK